ncbi:MAG TPA: Nif3-like dinuclear metal center hexameric protein, partial [Fimbriimonadaceae bacterium]|nr:Nif3-like dinuclear metal center hexameric protein [Fimbriimonadaceae bacterium]
TVDRQLEARSFAWGDPGAQITWVGIVGGAADDDWRAAKEAGCDVFVTGEVKQHNAVEAGAFGFPIIAAGHYATEQPGAAALADAMREAVPSVDWKLFVPEPGFGGRPL